MNNPRTFSLVCLLLCCLGASGLIGQTTLLSDPGASYLDSNGPTGPDVYSVDVSSCTSISFSVDYSFTLPWEGNGNMEYCNEMNGPTPVCFTGGGCACDPTMPTAGGCNFCWDFLWIRFNLDGTTVGGDLIGDANTTNAEQNGTISLGPICTDGASTGDITAVTQTWSVNEGVTFTNLVILCWEAAPTVNTNAPICSGQTLSLNGSVNDPSVVQNWSWSNDGGGSIANPNVPNTNATNVQNGETYTLVTTDVNGCTGSDDVTIILTPGPAANSGVNLQLCENPPGSNSATFDLTSLDGLISVAPGNTVNWYSDPAGTILIPSPTSFVASNNTSVYATVSDGICESAPVEVTLLVSPGPVADAGPDLTVCGQVGSAITISGATATNGSILWTNSGTGVLIGATTSTPQYFPSTADIAAGSVVLTLTVSSPGCPTATDNVTINLTPAPTVNPGGIGIYVTCEGQPVMLNGTFGPPGNIPTWTTNASGFFDDPNDPNTNYNPGPTDLANSPIFITLTVVDPTGVCPPAISITTITITPGPTATPGLDLTACETVPGSGLAQFDLTSLDPLVSGGTGTVSWFLDAAGLNPIPNPLAHISPNNGIVYATVTVAGCESAPEAVTLLVNPAPFAEAGNGLNICSNGADGFLLSSASALNGTISWTSSGTGFFNNPTISNPFYFPTGTDIASGSVDLTLTVSAPGCPDAVDVVTINLFPLPSGSAGGPYNTCAATPVVLNGLPNPGNTVVWSTSGDGSFSAVNLPNATYTPGPGDITAGSVLLTLTITDPFGLCPSATEDVVLTITPGPVANTGVSLEACEDSPGSGVATFDLTLADLGISGGLGTVIWYLDPAGTVNIPNPTLFLANNNTSVYARVDDGACQSDAVEVLLLVNAAPTADAGGDLDFCANGSNAINLITASAGGGNIQWTSSGTGVFSDPTVANPDYTPSAADIAAGSVSLTLTVSASGCPDASDQLVLNLGNPTFADPGGPYSTCASGSIQLNGSVNLGTTPQWSSGGDGSFDDPGLAAATYTPGPGDVAAGVVSLTFSATDPTGICGLAFTDVNLTISPAPTVSIAAPVSICAGENIVLSAVLGNGATTVSWSASGDGSLSGVFDNPVTYTPGPGDLAGGSVGFTATTDDVGGTCPAGVDFFTVNIQAAPNAGAPGASPNLCALGSPALLLNDLLTGEDAGGSWIETSTIPSTGGAFVANPGSFDPAGQAAGTYTFEYTVAGIPPCSASSSTVTINVIAAPFATVASNATTCDLAAQGSVLDFDALVTAGDQGGTWADTDGSGVDLSNTGAVDFDGIAPGSYNFTYTTNSATAPCVEATYVLSVLVQDCSCPDVATAAPPALCNDGGTLDLSGLVLTTESGSWAITNTPAGTNPATLLGNAFNAIGADAGDYELTFTLDQAPIVGCPDSSVQTLTVLAAPNAGVPDPTLSICNDAPGIILLNDRLVGEDPNGSWIETSAVPSTGGAFVPNPGSFDPSGQATGQYTFQYVVLGTSPCPNAGSMVTIELTAAPFADVAPNTTICNLSAQGSTLDFGTFVTAGDTGGSWADTDASGVNLSDPSNVDFDGLIAGTYTFTYTTNSATAPCSEQAYDIEILVQDCACPSVATSAPSNLCNDAGSLDLNSLVLTPEPGSWAITSSPTGTNPATLSGNLFDATGADPGDYQITYTINLAPIPGCPDSSVQTLSVFATPSAGSPEPILITCDDQNQSLSLFDQLSGEDGGGSWTETTTVPSTGTAFDPVAGTFNPFGQLTETYTFRYEVAGAGPCPSASSLVSIRVNAAPFADLVAGVNVCNLSAQGSTIDFRLLVTAGDASGSWTDTDGSGADLTVLNMVNFDGVPAGTYTFSYQTNSAIAPCNEQIYQLEITVEDCACPSVATLPPTALCNAGGSLDLSTLVATSEAGSWTISSTPVGSNPATLNGTIFEANTADPGDYQITYTLDLAPIPGCPDSSVQTLTVFAAPNAGVDVSPLTRCNSNPQVIDLADLLVGEDAGGIWLETSVVPSTGGAFDPSLGTFAPMGQLGGSYTFSYTVTGGGPCPDASSSVTVLLNERPIATVVTDTVVCNTSAEGSILDFNGLVIGGDLGGSWADTDASGVDLSNLANVDFDGVGPGVYAFTYTTNSATPPCTEQSYQLNVRVQSCVCPSVLTLPPSPRCNNQNLDLTSLQLSTEPGTWTITATPAGSNPAVISGDLFLGIAADPGTYEITFSLDAPRPGCPASSSQTLDLFSAPEAGTGQSFQICNPDPGTEIALFGLVTGGNPGGLWAVDAASPNSPNPGSFSPVNGTFRPAGNATGSYVFIYVVTGSPFCPADLTTVTVELNNLSVVIGGSASFCSGTSTTLQATPGLGSYVWSVPGNTTDSLVVSSPGLYSVTVSDGPNCSAEASIQVEERFPSQRTLDTLLCPGASVEVNGTIYDAANPSGTEILSGLAENACDSIVDVTVSFYPIAASLIERRLCFDESLSVNGTVYDRNNPTGVETLLGASARGCDSIVTVNLSFEPELTASISGPELICSGDSARLTFNFSGPGPFDVRYTDGTNTIVLAGIEDGATTTIPLSVATTFVLTDATSTVTACPVLLPNSILEVNLTEVQAQASAVVDYNGFGVSCPNAEDGSLVVEVTVGTGPFSYVWENGNTTDTLENIGAGQYRVVVTDANGCTTETLAELSAPPAPLVELTVAAPTCFGDTDGSFLLTDVSGPGQDYRFSIDGGLFEPIDNLPFLATGLAAGAYDLVVVDENNCEESAMIDIPEATAYQLELGEDEQVDLGDSIWLDPITNMEVVELRWEPEDFIRCPECLETFVTPLSTETYTLTIRDSLGCEVRDRITLRVRTDLPVYLPNVFSPNADGSNDYFFVQGRADIRVASLRVFDRWGELVFAREDLPMNIAEAGWDGRLDGQDMNPAVFVYVVELVFVDGRREMISGDVTLMR
ncbi:MAG: gliding motility-associated C-terminal domain-containing protein [Bacteroidota bacterium]